MCILTEIDVSVPQVDDRKRGQYITPLFTPHKTVNYFKIVFSILKGLKRKYIFVGQINYTFGNGIAKFDEAYRIHSKHYG